MEHVLPDSGTSRKDRFHLTTDSLDQESSLLLHSLLAVSAVRLAWDMISQEGDPEPNAVHMVLMRGYQHYNMASKMMRIKLSYSDKVDADQVMTSTLMVLPFAAASQQISHWLSTQNTDQRSHTLLSSTPRDVITFVRGARTMTEILLPLLSIAGRNVTAIANQESTVVTGPFLSTQELRCKQNIRSIIIPSSRDAWSKLQVRLDLLHHDMDVPLDHEASACEAALGVLVELRACAIAVLSSPCSRRLRIEGTSSKHTMGWLDSFVHWPCRVDSKPLLPAEPLTRLLLSFYAQVPQAYLELVLPLLDQRLEHPVGESPDWFALSLTRTQALALDIYAHWSVLMFLAAERSWWIGTLPEVTLTGLVNRYGSNFVTRLWPECGNQKEWWPAEMLRKLADHKNE